MNQCSGTCGFILTNQFPTYYGSNQRTNWVITVSKQKYIKLVFLEFDIYEEPLNPCSRDYVDVRDFDLTGLATSMGR
jgi:hypothetical protein